MLRGKALMFLNTLMFHLKMGIGSPSILLSHFDISLTRKPAN